MAGMAFASVMQLESRWRPLSTEEQSRAEVLLTDASEQVRVECRGIEDRITSGALDPVVPERVVCDMVKRAMLADDSPGVETVQEGAGPFQTSFKYTNPMGDLYLTKTERRLLGCGGARAFTVDVTPAVVEGGPWLTTTL